MAKKRSTRGRSSASGSRKKKSTRKAAAKKSAGKTTARKTTSRTTGRRASARAGGARSVATRSTSQPGVDEVPLSPWRQDEDTILHGLRTGEGRAELEAYFGEAVYEEMRRLALEADAVRAAGRPRVLLLPGIMGSKLGRDRFLIDDSVWFDPIDVIAGRLWGLTLDEGGAEGIEPLGVILLYYLKLKLRLRRAGYDVSFHPFDWRRPIAGLGEILADRIREEAADHERVHLVAHSMGGLVSRAAMKQLDAAGDGGLVPRLVMLGTPNHGSFSPVRAFRGTHESVRMIARMDITHSIDELVRGVFTSFSGLYQMLPSPERHAVLNYLDPNAWPARFDDDEHAIGPRIAELNAAAGVQADLAPGDDRMRLIAGVNQETIVSMELAEDPTDDVAQMSLAGDGTVPLDFAHLDGVPTLYVEEGHGSLPNNRTVARAVADLLARGTTDVLPSRWTAEHRGVTRVVREAELAEPLFEHRTGAEISPQERRHVLAGFLEPPMPEDVPAFAPVAAPVSGAFPTSREAITIGRERQRQLEIHLAHGSVTQVDARALMLGLYQGVAPSGPARAIDRELNGAITEFTERRMFDCGVGEMFIMPAGRHTLGAEAVVFAGLGPFDEFDEDVLRLTSEHVARTLVRTKVDEFATVLIGAGSKMDLRQSLAALLEGFLRGLRDSDGRRRIRRVTLCEMDRVRYEAMRSELIRLASTTLFDEFAVTIDEVDPEDLRYLPAPSTAHTVDRSTDAGVDPVYLFLREDRHVPVGFGDEASPHADELNLQASLLTAGGRATVISGLTDISRPKLDELIDDVVDARFPEQEDLGRRLAELVLPAPILEVLRHLRDRPLVLIHDAEASLIPWESMWLRGAGESGASDGDPWAPARTVGLTRKYDAAGMSPAKWLQERRLDDVLDVLLIVDPTEDLEGARIEGGKVREMLQRLGGARVRTLVGPDATWSAIRSELSSGRYDAVHYAGHAHFDERERSRSGILCHGRHVLSGADLASLGQLPALMVFNACESGRVRSGEPPAREQAVGMAEAFLRGGVGNFVGTYWPVGDRPAVEFARALYTELLGGEPIGRAIRAGRERLFGLEERDWANYLHYGSPGFRLKIRRDRSEAGEGDDGASLAPDEG